MSAQARRLVSGGSKESKCGVSAEGASATLHIPLAIGERQASGKVECKGAVLAWTGAKAFNMCRTQP